MYIRNIFGIVFWATLYVLNAQYKHTTILQAFLVLLLRTSENEQ